MNFSDKLKKCRMELGLTQDELANKLYISRSLIAQYENGKMMPTKENLEKISSFFDKKISYFIDEDDVIELALSHNKTALMIDKFFFIFIITIEILFILISILPIFKHHFYFSDGEGTSSTIEIVTSLIKHSLLNDVYIVLITIILCTINISLSFLLLFKRNFKGRIWIKLINYILFVVLLFFMFFSLITSISSLNSFR